MKVGNVFFRIFAHKYKNMTMKQLGLFLCILCTSLLGACISEPTPSDTNHVVGRILTRSSNTEEIISEGQTALFNIFKDRNYYHKNKLKYIELIQR